MGTGPEECGEEGASTGVAGPAPGQRRADFLLLQIFLHHPGHTSTRLHSLLPSGFTDGRGSAPELSQQKGVKGAFPAYISIFIFLVYARRKWLCVESWFENGKIRVETLVGKVNFLRSHSAQTHTDHIRIKFSSS